MRLHFLLELWRDVPDELECRPRADNEDGGDENAQHLHAEYCSRALHLLGSAVADPSESIERKALPDGLSDATREIERAVDRALGTLAGGVFIIVDRLTDQAPLHLHGDHGHSATYTEHNAVYERMDVHRHMHCEEYAEHRAARQERDAYQLWQIVFFTKEGDSHHRSDHEGCGEYRADGLIGYVVVYRKVHVHAECVGAILHSADADTVDAQGDERTVLGEDGENVGELDALGVGCLLHTHSLLGHKVVHKADYKADDGTADADDHIAGRVAVAEGRDDYGGDDARDGVTKARSRTSRRGERGALYVVLRHGGEERAHRDIEHSVRRLVEDLGGEEHYQKGDTGKECRHRPQRYRRYCQQGCRAQNPGSELSPRVALFGERLVHQRTHQWVVDRVPNSPYDN